MNVHCDEELVGLLAGELGGDETRAVVAHLRECGDCTSVLISVAVAYGSMRAARRAEASLSRLESMPGDAVAPVTLVPDNQPPLEFSPRTSRSWRPAAVAALALVVAGTGVAWGLTHRGSATVTAMAALHHMQAPVSAQGVAKVTAIGSLKQMQVTTVGLPQAPANHYYEVWLLQPSTNKMLPVGVLSPSGVSTYTVASSIMSQFSAVDISLQTNDGSTAHSTVSVLRGSVQGV